MPFPTKQKALSIQVESMPQVMLPLGERRGFPRFGEKPEYDPGEYRVFEWHEADQMVKSMVTDQGGVRSRIAPLMSRMDYPSVAIQSALDRLHNFKRIVLNVETGEVFTRSVEDYDQLEIFGDALQRT